MNDSFTRTNLHCPGYPPESTEKHAYSAGVRSGQIIWVSGQTAMNAQGEFVGVDDIEAQAVHVLDKIKGILADGGASMDDVVKTTIYITDASFRETVQRLRWRYFRAPNFPASALIVVKALARPQLLVEIEAIAVIGSRLPSAS